jgi:hypothetical protein
MPRKLRMEYPGAIYHLKWNVESWLIRDFASECLNCRCKFGITSYLFCQGRGWLHQEDILEAIKRMERSDRGTTGDDQGV